MKTILWMRDAERELEVCAGFKHHSRVGCQRRGHGPRDDLLILAQVCEGGEWKTPVRDLEQTLSESTPGQNLGR